MRATATRRSAGSSSRRRAEHSNFDSICKGLASTVGPLSLTAIRLGQPRQAGTGTRRSYRPRCSAGCSTCHQNTHMQRLCSAYTPMAGRRARAHRDRSPRCTTLQTAAMPKGSSARTAGSCRPPREPGSHGKARAQSFRKCPKQFARRARRARDHACDTPRRSRSNTPKPLRLRPRCQCRSRSDPCRACNFAANRT